MVEYFIDTSALIKRYKDERGSETIDSIFKEPNKEKLISSLSIVEALNIFYGLYRKNKITNNELQKIISFLYRDIEENIVKVYEVTKEHALKSEPQIKRAQFLPVRNRRERPDPIDVLIITCALDFKDLNLIFVSSDLDLNQLAKQENIQVLNPEEK